MSESTMPATVAQQSFAIISGVGGGLAGMYLARSLTGVTDVPVPAVASAAIVSGVATFGAAFIIIREVEKLKEASV